MTVDKSRTVRPSIASVLTLEDEVHEKCRHATPWKSIWICIILQFVIGIQISIYYMSLWPYLSGMDTGASMHFVGWVVASASIGCSVANPLFGWWNEKLLEKGGQSVVKPTIVGFVISAVGQLLYGLLPLIGNVKWFMIGSRLITGFGTGCMAVLRTYIATACLPQDRLSAISYGTGGWVLGLSAGPAIQAIFTPIGHGWHLNQIVLNMYTLPAFFMVIILLLSCVFVAICLKEEYAGIIDSAEQDANKVIIPKFDAPPAMICVWLWAVSCMISTNIEVISTPLSTALYGWNDSTSILLNGIIESVTCIVSVFINFIIGYTRIGQIDKRKQIIFGLSIFLLYHVLNFPWPFYPGPLSYIPVGFTSQEIGGCERDFTWCESTPRIPLFIYLFSFIVLFGMAFPFVGSPSASLYTEILGPRPQGMLQGMYSFGGSMSQFIAPIFATFLFQHTGYLWVIVTQIATLTIALVLMLVYYKRLIPLELKSTSKKLQAKMLHSKWFFPSRRRDRRCPEQFHPDTYLWRLVADDRGDLEFAETLSKTPTNCLDKHLCDHAELANGDEFLFEGPNGAVQYNEDRYFALFLVTRSLWKAGRQLEDNVIYIMKTQLRKNSTRCPRLIKREFMILKTIQSKKKKFAPTLVGTGKVEVSSKQRAFLPSNSSVRGPRSSHGAELHDMNYIYSDCKPTNIACGVGKESAKVFLDKIIRIGVPDGYTPPYWNIDYHKKHKVSKKTDLGQWLYTTIDLAQTGCLPWKNFMKLKDVLVTKEQFWKKED